MIIPGKIFKKTWVIGAAVALIVGSTSVMAFALNNNIPENATSNVAASVKAEIVSSQDSDVIGNVAASVKPEIVSSQDSDVIVKKAPVYIVVDRTKQLGDLAQLKDKIKEDLNNKAGMTPEKVDQGVKDAIASMTPGEKDMTADQAAAYCADIVQQAYGIDLTGLTAEASFSKNPLPYSDNWEVIFRVPNQVDSSVRYYASINSVTGAMLDAGSYDCTYREEHNTDLSNPDWLATAVKDISAILPAHVTITSSKVVSASAFGVTVVCNLSDGSACAVRLTGENKTAAAYTTFQNGYDGSLAPIPATAEGVG